MLMARKKYTQVICNTRPQGQMSYLSHVIATQMDVVFVIRDKGQRAYFILSAVR